MSRYLLNAVAVGTDEGGTVLMGKQAYDRETLVGLQKQHAGSYFFKRGGTGGGFILSVALRSGLPQIGTEVEEVALSGAHWLLVPLAREALLQTFLRLGRPALKDRPLRILSQRPLNLFPSGPSVPTWLQRRLVLEFDTREIRGTDDKVRAVLACNVRTRNFIDANCAELQRAGVPLQGQYVATRYAARDARVQDQLRLAGRVLKVDGRGLTLEDHGDGPRTLQLEDAFLEPRKENMLWCARHVLGRDWERVVAEADAAAARLLTGPERLSLLRRTFDYLRTQNIELAPGCKLQLGPLAGSENGSWPFRTETVQKPVLVFDPSGTRTDKWNERGLDDHGPYDQRTFSPKQLKIAVVCQSPFEGQVDGFLAKFLDGLPDVRTGTGDWARAPYAKGFIRRYALEAPKLHTFTTAGSSAADYAAACREAVEYATSNGFEWNLALVQIDKDFRELDDARNPYFSTKAVFLKHRVPVQEITLETMSFADQQLVYALNNMSVATYAKIGGTPWLLKSQPTVAHELVIGIGSQSFSSSRLGAKERVVGITTVFTSDGRYLLEDRTAAVDYDQYAEALFRSLERSIKSVRETDNWRSTDAVRLIFHVFKELAVDEAKAVGELVERLGLSHVKYAFVHVVDQHPFAVFDEANAGTRNRGGMKGVLAPERGLSVSLTPWETLLSFTGGRDLKQTHDGMPLPTLLRLHRQSTFRDMTYLSRQAFAFACHSWRMFTPAPLPITIHYSELMARLLTGLRHVPEWDPDTLLGSISRTRWFL